MYSALLDLTAEEESEAAPPFGTFLRQVGAALAEDDLDVARDALDELSKDNPLGRAFDLTA